MHILQYIAVQADNADEAMRTVEDTLNSELGNNEYATNAWFDWFVVGGGRFTEGDPYQSSPNSIISYKDEPEEFVQMIDIMLNHRISEFNGYAERFKEKNIDVNLYLDKYDGNTDYSFELYELNQMIEMFQGSWNYNSYFYDMHHASTNPKFMLDNLNDSWYLIPIDFHS